MGDYPSDRRRYSDKEMALILKLASELEPRGEAAEGRSLAEVTVGTEVQAALAIEAGGAESPVRRPAGCVRSPTRWPPRWPA